MLGLGVGFYKLGGDNYPGGWDPKALGSKLIHWYQYDTGLTVDAEDDITQWTDQKGSNNLTAEGTSAVSPTYDSGKVFFNANNDILTFGSSLDLTTFAIYFRAEWAAFEDGDFIFEETTNEFLKLHNTTTMRLKIAGGSRHDTTISELSTDTKYNMGIEREDTAETTNDQIYLFINNASQTVGGSGGGTQAITDTFEITTIGKPANNLKLYEIVICDNVLSATERNELNSYLNKI